MTQHPLEQKGNQPAILEDLLETALRGQQDCVDKAITMIEDLQLHGTQCRFIKPLAGAVMELKARTDDGGARVYFFRVAENAFALGRFECKKEDAASQKLLNWTAQVAMFFDRGNTEVIV
jgi:hypothetical protein